MKEVINCLGLGGVEGKKKGAFVEGVRYQCCSIALSLGSETIVLIYLVSCYLSLSLPTI